MSDSLRNEFASALKWTWVIIIAAIAYNIVAPNYFYMRQGPNFYRGNKVTGHLEELGNFEWINISEKKG